MTESFPSPPEKPVLAEAVDTGQDPTGQDPTGQDQAGQHQTRTPPALPWRQCAAAMIMAVLCDAAIYPNGGLMGFAVVFLAAPLVLVLGRSGARLNTGVAITVMLLVALAARQAWCGMFVANIAGVLLLAALAMGLAGLRPYVLEAPLVAILAIPMGLAGLIEFGVALKHVQTPRAKLPWLSIALPLGALAAFGLLFVLANPDLAKTLEHTFVRVFESGVEWLMNNFSPDPLQIFFWGVVGMTTFGILSPYVSKVIAELHSFAPRRMESAVPSSSSLSPSLYRGVFNMLASVIGLFGVYLIFEFATLWFREFPQGFYYAGYAHQGAAWLTVALGLATVVLSLVFRGKLQADPRSRVLRRLAWIWSFQNLLLAMAVYNRLFIYVNFNGMTRMRTVGLFGITAVVIGFGLVVWKIARRKDFAWLLQRHLWTLALTIVVFMIFPVDAITTRYNVRRVLAGDLAPSVQLSVHSLNSEGALQLEPLLSCSDPVIREGIRALLAERREQLENPPRPRWRRRRQDVSKWTEYQLADEMLLSQLRSMKSDLARYGNESTRSKALNRFHEYAYQWY